MKIDVPISTKLRNEASPDALWRSEDKGLIQAWEIGRRQALKKPELAEKAVKGQLPASDLFQGGYNKRLEATFQYGSLHYYCMWLGWRGQDLDIDLDEEYPVVCAKTRMGVVYTLDSSKYLTSGMSKTGGTVRTGVLCEGQWRSKWDTSHVSSMTSMSMPLARYSRAFSTLRPYFPNFQSALPAPPTTR